MLKMLKKKKRLKNKCFRKMFLKVNVRRVKRSEMGVGRGMKVQKGNPLNSEMAEGGRRKAEGGRRKAFGVLGWEVDGAGNEGDRWHRWRRRRIVCSKDVEVPDGRAAVVSGALWGLLVFVLRGPPFPLV